MTDKMTGFSLREWRAAMLYRRVNRGMLLSEAARSIGISYALAREIAGVA